ncbi:MAG: hypothetical protein KC486_15580, partial [Myxococcales bacterium]|nr:hypothetical protein [Myxococcales bacterium]
MTTRSGNEEDTRRDAAARADAATGATLIAAADRTREPVDPRQLSTGDTLIAPAGDPRVPVDPRQLATSDTLIAPDADAASAPVSGIAATAVASADEAATFIAGARAPRSPARGSARGRGATLGRYLILERLGAGGMGEVYAAYDPELDRKVAIKLLRRELSGAGTSGSSRLLREAQSMARLSHPNVV